jgi:hypothetical protein
MKTRPAGGLALDTVIAPVPRDCTGHWGSVVGSIRVR